jgi:hypothetical protein
LPEARALFEKALKEQSAILHKYNLTLLATVNALLNTCVDLQDWASAKKYCKSTVLIYKGNSHLNAHLPLSRDLQKELAIDRIATVHVGAIVLVSSTNRQSTEKFPRSIRNIEDHSWHR